MSEMTLEQLAYRPGQFAKLTGLSEGFVKLEIYRGKLHAVKKGTATLITAEAARKYLSESDAPQSAQAQDMERK